jgi:hypothetical protein
MLEVYIRIQQVNEANERLLKSDVKCRFVIDMAIPMINPRSGFTTLRAEEIGRIRNEFALPCVY